MDTLTETVTATPSAGRVLVVDDEPVNRAVMEGMLVPLGFEVDAVADGEAALVRVLDGAPDVVLLDVMMPGIDGFEVCRRLKSDARTALVPVVMVTALDADRHRVRGIEAGADDFLSKPVDHVELQARVRSLVARSHLQARLHTTESVLLTLATAVDVRDDVTGGHCTRLADNADVLADVLRLDGADREVLRWAAVLHDVGKLGVPDAVLNKPGGLTDDEWVQMRAHASLGERIVSPLGGLDAVRPIIRHHHERWDGRGYPDGLAGTAIPYLARAFQLLDVFDALTSVRPYRDPLPPDLAVALMRKERGTVLDPDLFDLFEEHVAPRCHTEQGALA